MIKIVFLHKAIFQYFSADLFEVIALKSAEKLLKNYSSSKHYKYTKE